MLTLNSSFPLGIGFIRLLSSLLGKTPPGSPWCRPSGLALLLSLLGKTCGQLILRVLQKKFFFERECMQRRGRRGKRERESERERERESPKQSPH